MEDSTSLFASLPHLRVFGEGLEVDTPAPAHAAAVATTRAVQRPQRRRTGKTSCLLTAAFSLRVLITCVV